MMRFDVRSKASFHHTGELIEPTCENTSNWGKKFKTSECVLRPYQIYPLVSKYLP